MLLFLLITELAPTHVKQWGEAVPWAGMLLESEAAWGRGRGHRTQDPLAELLKAALPYDSVCPGWLLG